MSWEDDLSDSEEEKVATPSKPSTKTKSNWDDSSDDDEEEDNSKNSSNIGGWDEDDFMGGGGGSGVPKKKADDSLWDNSESEEEDQVKAPQKVGFGDVSSSDDDVKEAWDADSDEERAKKAEKQKPGVAAKKKIILHKKKKNKLLLRAQKQKEGFVDEEDPDEDPADRKRRIAEQQQKADIAAAEDLFGISSSGSESDLDNGSCDEIDRAATTEDPSFMSADGNLDELGDMDGPKIKVLDFKTIRIKGKDEIDQISLHLNELLTPYKQNAPYVNILTSFVKALGERIDPETIQQAVSALNRLTNEKVARTKNLKGRRKPKRTEVKPIPKSEATARAAASKKAKPIEFWYYAPVYKEDYDTFGSLIGKGVESFARNSHFSALICTLLRDFCAHLEPEEIRLVIQPLNRVATEKIQIAKPKKKVSTRATLAGAGKGADEAYLHGDY